MSMTISTTVYSPTPSVRPPRLPFRPSSLTRLSHTTRSPILSRSAPNTTQQPIHLGHKHNFSGQKLGFSFARNLGLFAAKAADNGENGGGKMSVEDEAERAARGQSTMPDRFRVVLWELFNWKKAVGAIARFLGYLSKFVLALIFHFIGDPVTSLIRGVETALYTVRAFYSGIVAYAPIPELTTIIMLASAVLAIGEATVPDSVSSQPYLLTVAGLIGFAAVRGFISELFFWTLLLGLFGFARFVKKRDYVSSALPVAAALAAIGETWVRVVVMASYLALAITHHSKKPVVRKDDDAIATGRRVPLPLLWAALAIGIRVAAKWAGYRHLTWMIV
ncbi:hypothetical protein RJ639_005227 [Escallonia herrerae]|uniref:Uncharacterized protein n=1 Tax=Escallonia herrerae TaxID=1293975 RepID=A0AA88W250_9ASTE|nr:hypothetical protein RJ639_005227 [Escallonia herrerae]